MTPYKVGYCCQCQAQIMVQDSDGKWNTFKPNWRQANLEFDDGHQVSVPLCAGCLENIDFAKIMEALTHQDSQAGGELIKEKLKFKKAKNTPKKDEIVLEGRLFKEVKQGEDKPHDLTFRGKHFADSGEWVSEGRLERGLPVRIESWKYPTGKMIQRGNGS